MPDPTILAILMFPVTIAVLVLGFPVAFVLSGVPILFALAGEVFGISSLTIFSAIPSRIFGIMTNQVFVAIPLFVFMGLVLERARIAEDLLYTLGLVFGALRGGLGIAVIVVGALLAASTGVVGATVVTMGLLSLPVMLRAGYDPRLACGVICSSGTLGQIIPPSTILILLGDILQGANAQAQMAKGNFAPEPLSVIDLFAGAFIPGLLLVALYILGVVLFALVRPASCPALVERGAPVEGLGIKVLTVLVPPLALILAVLGSILAGIATATESAAIGAIGALVLAALRRTLTLAMLQVAMRRTLQITVMIYAIMIGASIFALAFRAFGGDGLVADLMASLPGGTFGAMLFLMVVIFLLGFILDFVEIMFLVLPIVGPIMLMHDISPIWFGVMVAMNLQTSFLTPPFGYSLFYLRSVAPPSVTSGQIYAGLIPFTVLQLCGLALVGAFPGLATWLPSMLFD